MTHEIKVFLSLGDGQDDAELLHRFAILTPDETVGVWKNVRGVARLEDADFMVVLQHESRQSLKMPPEKIVYLQLEPPEVCEPARDRGFKAYCVFVNGFVMIAAPWVFKPFNFLRDLTFTSIPKTRNLILITSAKSHLPGHRQRLQFVADICSIPGLDIDVYGRDLDPNICNGHYRGRIEGYCKFDILSQYHYAVVIENSRHENYITEKLYDCMCCLTFPIYYGCPNADKLLPRNSFALLDLFTISAIVQKPPSAAMQSAMLQAKNDVLFKYNIWEQIHRAVSTQ